MNFAAAAKRSLASTSNAASKPHAAVARPDAMKNLLSGLEGRIVIVEINDGRKYEGVLASFTSESYTLKMVQLLHSGSASSRNTNSFEPKRVFKFAEVSSVLVKKPHKLEEVEASSPSASANANPAVAGQAFRTDADISSSFQSRENRRLEKWNEGSSGSRSMTLDEEARMSSNGRGWNQFEVNKKLFGYESSYHEDNYTMPVDRDSAFYKHNERQAAQLAREIESESTSNPHVAEERGQKSAYRNMNPEDRFSTVLDDSKGKSSSPVAGGTTGKYQIPAKRSTSPPRPRTESSPSPRTASPAQKASVSAPVNAPEPASSPAAENPEEKEAPAPAEIHKDVAEAKTSEPKSPVKKGSKLNANAKEFSLSAGAKEFVPNFGGAGGAAAFAVPQMMPMQHMGGYQPMHPMMPYAPYGYAQPPSPVYGAPMAYMGQPIHTAPPGYHPMMGAPHRGRSGPSRGRGRGRGGRGHSHSGSGSGSKPTAASDSANGSQDKSTEKTTAPSAASSS